MTVASPSAASDPNSPSTPGPPSPGTAAVPAALLERACALLGEESGPAGPETDQSAFLIRQLRRLYRAQNRLDQDALRQLGRACLQAVADDASADGAQLRAAAALLADCALAAACPEPAVRAVQSDKRREQTAIAPQTEPAAVRPRPPSRPSAATSRLELSVVIRACSDQPRLRVTVGSLLRDAPANMEIIVAVDDGYADDNLALARELAAADERIRVIHQAKALTAAARNAGLSAASGDYMGFVDEGDEAEPGWARALLRAAKQKHRPAIVKGEARVFQGGRELPPQRTCAVMAQCTPLHWFALTGSAIYRRDFVQDHDLHFAQEFFCDDADFQVRAVVAAILDKEQVALCPQAVYRRLRRPGDSESSALARSESAAAINAYAGLHELFLKHWQRLPAAGVGAQYFTWIRNLFELARRARYPQDGVAANDLAQRMLLECPCPDQLEDERERVALCSP